jgi:YVTN family beta-propeller protein
LDSVGEIIMLLRFASIFAFILAITIPAQAHPIAFVTNCCHGGSSVSVIGTHTDKEIAGIPTGTYTIAVATSPDGLRAYAANSGSNTVSVIDTSSHRDVGTISMTYAPISLTVSPDSQRLYVTVCTTFDPILGCIRGAVDVISIATGASIALIRMDGVPNDLKFTPDGKTLVVAAYPLLVEINVAHNYIKKAIQAPSAAPQWVVITPDGLSAYTTGSGLWLFDLNTGAATMESNQGFTQLGISPDGKLLYSLLSSNLDTISTSNYGIVASVAAAQLPYGLAVAPDGRRAYVTDAVNSNVAIVDLVREQLVRRAPVAYLPVGLAVTPNSSEVYVSNSDSSTISAIDVTTNQLVGQAEAGARPRRVTTTPDGSHAYVANWLGRTVSVIDARAISKITDIDVGYSPYNVAMSPDGHYCYVNLSGEGVAFINTSTNRVEQKLRYGPGGVTGDLSDLAVSPDGANLFALDAQTGFFGVRIIDARTAKLVGNIRVAPLDGLSTMTMRPDGSKLYISAYFAKAIDVVDVGTRRVTETIPLSVSPEYVEASPDGHRLYIVLGTNVVGAMDLRTEKIVARVTIPVQYGIGGITVTPDGSRLYVTGSDVYAVDTATMKVVHDTPIGADTWGATVSH